jgi:hypothetical protein
MLHGLKTLKWKLVLRSYLSIFSCFLAFIYSFCYYVFLSFVSSVFPLVCLSLYWSSVRLIVVELAGPTQSYPAEIRSLSQAFVVLYQFVIFSIQGKRLHVVHRRLLILVSHYLNNGRKRILEVSYNLLISESQPTTLPVFFVLKDVIKHCVMQRPRPATSLYEGVAYRALFSSSQLMSH